MTSKETHPQFSYPEVGATATTLPEGYAYLRAQRVVGEGQAIFESCGNTILTWGIQSGAGFRVEQTGRVVNNAQNRLGLHWGPFQTWAVCQVVYVIDEPNRKGFAYGTLPGHPESGEESFIVSMADDDVVTFDITAFSRPARWFAKLGGPLVRFLQQHVTWKYLDAIHPPRVERNAFLAAVKRNYFSPGGNSWVRTSGKNVFYTETTLAVKR